MKKIIVVISALTLLISVSVFSKEKQKIVINIDDFSKKKIPLAITSFKNI